MENGAAKSTETTPCHVSKYICIDELGLGWPVREQAQNLCISAIDLNKIEQILKCFEFLRFFFIFEIFCICRIFEIFGIFLRFEIFGKV